MVSKVVRFGFLFPIISFLAYAAFNSRFVSTSFVTGVNSGSVLQNDNELFPTGKLTKQKEEQSLEQILSKNKDDFLPGAQRLPQAFQGFIGSTNHNSVGSGVSHLTGGLDLETYTKNQAIRANQENAIVAQLSTLSQVRRNQLARDISGGSLNATNEFVSNLLRDLAVTPAGNMAFSGALTPPFGIARDPFTIDTQSNEQQQQLMLARMLAEEQQQRINRLLQLQALNGNAFNRPLPFSNPSTQQLLQQQLLRQQLQSLQGSTSPFTNQISSSNTNPSTLQQQINDRLLRNQMLQLQQQRSVLGQTGLNSALNNQQQQVLTRPSPSDLASSSVFSSSGLTKTTNSSQSGLQFGDTRMPSPSSLGLRDFDVDASSSILPAFSSSASINDNNAESLSKSQKFGRPTAGFVDAVADAFGHRLPSLRDSAVPLLKGGTLVNKNGTSIEAH
ncbi:hypothetical protein Ddc_04115 [Ditylenchus destructor]|nr:hypothetical protein Ddc_04115 [Ditylenchus destructor]